MLPLPNMVRRRRRPGSLIGCAVLVTMTLVTAIVATIPSPASAKSYEINTQLVRHDDLNLANPKDVSKLHRRVSRAAKNPCSLPGIASHFLKRDINDCVEETQEEALPNLEHRIAVMSAETRPKN